MKKFLSVLLILALVLGMAACGSGGDAEKDGGEVKTYIVGTEPTFPPFETIDEATGEITGFDIELIQAIADDQGFKVDVQQMGFDAIVGAVQTGVAHIGASGMSITPDRLETVDFSDPYFNAGLAVAVAMDNETIGVSEDVTEDLQDKVCGVQMGTTGATKAQELYEQGILKEVKVYNTVDVVMQELSSHGVDCVINDIPVTEQYMSKMPDKIKMVGGTLVADDYGFAVMKGNTELLDMINAGLANVKANGVYDQLKDKWCNTAE